MNINQIFELIVIFLGGISMYTPLIQLKGKERLTGKELSKKYPQYGWMRWGFITLYIIWVAIVSFFLYEALILSWMKSFSFVGGVFASIGLFIGLFAVITGVSFHTTSAPRILFVVGDDAVKAGRFQVAWSLVVILIASIMEFLHR